MSAYPQSDDLEPGTWKAVEGKGSPDSALFICPRCGTKLALLEHEIEPDGSVFPAVTCGVYPCTFSQYVELRGWGKS